MKPTLRLFAACALALLSAATLPLAPRARSVDGPVFAEYAVAADHPDASQAGASLLAAGGNAADAAAATMLALGVVSPTGSGLGGGGFGLYYRAKDRTLTFLDFREVAPAQATAEMFRAREGESKEATNARSRKGGLAVGVPGEPLGIAELVSRFGTKPLSEIVAPAEKLARSGFSTSAHTVRILGMMGGAFAGDPLIQAVFGKQPSAGANSKNTALADTLARFGREGPKLFYTGALAKQIVRAVKAHGGVLSEQDLAKYSVVTREPLRDQALGYDWVTAPLPSAGGYTVMQSLHMLERWLPTPAHWQSTERYHALIESWKGPFLDRQAYLGDPAFAQIPLAQLNDPKRIEARAARYHPALALPGSVYALPLAQEPPKAVQPDNRGTSHVCVVDAEGNIATVTTTVNLPFGSHLNVGGFWLNDQMDDFASEVGKNNAFGLIGGAPNLPQPGKRPLSSMTPTIVFQGDTPILCVGGSGGSRITTAVEQVALYVLEDGMHPLQAITAPRVHHQVDPEQVDARGLPEAVIKELTLRGHALKSTQWAAHVQAIRIGSAGPERLQAASDPAKGGEPRGR